MFLNILVPTDGSSLAEKAVEAAIDYAQHSDSQIVLLSIAEPYSYAFDTSFSFGAVRERGDTDVSAIGFAQQSVETALNLARMGGVRCKSRVALSFMPYQEIVAAAKDFDCDAIFMATHGLKGIRKLLTGSETQRVLEHTTLPVLVLR